MSVEHYENFPVASWLCPPALRPAVTAIYHFARTADDIADEGDDVPQARLETLARYRADLAATASGANPSPRWPQVFGPLGIVLREWALPLNLLTDLLSAFEQDVVKSRYVDRAELLDYCRRSANPVGRLLLYLYGVGGTEAVRQSDAICSALQLANFWQDLSIDTVRGRTYVPDSDCVRHGVERQALLDGQDSASVRAMVCDLVGWTRQLMLSGAPLVHAIPGRAGWELRLVVQGGLAILEKIEAMNFATLGERPALRWHDLPRLARRAIGMRQSVPRTERHSA